MFYDIKTFPALCKSHDDVYLEYADHCNKIYKMHFHQLYISAEYLGRHRVRCNEDRKLISDSELLHIEEDNVSAQCRY